MSTNKTENYQLNQWVKSDQVKMEDFNADNAKIDAALKAQSAAIAGKASASALSSLQSTVSGKASASALNSLKTTVDGLKTSKADQSALDTLSAAVSGHTSTLAGKGNCQLYTTSYTGDGQYDAFTKSLTFPKQPWVVFIGGREAYLVMVRGAASAPAAVNFSLFLDHLTWSGKSVSWRHTGNGGAPALMNVSGATYQVVALLQAD